MSSDQQQQTPLTVVPGYVDLGMIASPYDEAVKIQLFAREGGIHLGRHEVSQEQWRGHLETPQFINVLLEKQGDEDFLNGQPAAYALINSYKVRSHDMKVVYKTADGTQESEVEFLRDPFVDYIEESSQPTSREDSPLA